MINDLLLIRYLEGDTSQKEKDEIHNWIEKDSGNLKHFNYLKVLFQEENPPKSHEMEEDWLALNTMMNRRERIDINPATRASKWLVRAAAAIIILIGTVLLFDTFNNKNTIRGTSDDPAAYLLPDGSQVFLNKGAKLTYTDSFNIDQREVSISGEAFFRVTPGLELPFIVHTGGTKIKVTGTSFSVSAPGKEEDIEVTVKTGKVLFYNSETFSENSFKVDLGPGDKGIYYPSLNLLNKSHDKDYKKLNFN